jgi:hypothetical protein
MLIFRTLLPLNPHGTQRVASNMHTKGRHAHYTVEMPLNQLAEDFKDAYLSGLASLLHIFFGYTL